MITRVYKKVNNLSKYNYFMVTAKLSCANHKKIPNTGFKYLRDDLDAEIWWNPITNNQIKIEKISGFYTKEYLTTLIEQAGLTINEFIEL